MRTTTINAYAVTRPGGTAEPFSYERALGDHDVLVRVTHCSIARGDVQFIDNDWGDTRFPLVPGHEIVGLVEATGSRVTGVIAGDRVGIGYESEGLAPSPSSFFAQWGTGYRRSLILPRKRK